MIIFKETLLKMTCFTVIDATANKTACIRS